MGQEDNLFKLNKESNKIIKNEDEILRLTIFSILIVIFFQFQNIHNIESIPNPIGSSLINELVNTIGSFFFSFSLIFFIIYLMLLGIKYLYVYKINIHEELIYSTYDTAMASLVIFSFPSIVIFIFASVLDLTPGVVSAGLFLGFIISMGLFGLVFLIIYPLFLYRYFRGLEIIDKKKLYQTEHFQLFIMMILGVLLYLVFNLKYIL